MKHRKSYIKWMRFFQKTILKIEEKKFFIIDRFFPNFLKNNEKKLELFIEKEFNNINWQQELKKLQITIEKEDNLELKEILKNNYDSLEEMINKDPEQIKKMLLKKNILEIRKEYNRKENVNYHFDKNNPQKTLFYLNMNRDIHLKGIKKNTLMSSTFLILLCMSILIDFPSYTNELIKIVSISGLTIESISAFININCILLQDFNIKRINKYMEKAYLREQKKALAKAKEYKETNEIIANLIKESDQIPTIEEIINSLKTKEQVSQFLQMIKQEINYRNNSINNKANKKELKYY